MPSSVSDTLTINYSDDGATTCDDSLTVNWYYKQQTIAEWEEFSCPSGGGGIDGPITTRDVLLVNNMSVLEKLQRINPDLSENLKF